MVFRPNIDTKTCFVLMPFDGLHNDYFNAILLPAASSAGLKAIKADQIYGTQAIIQDIWQYIWSAQVVVADVTGRNPNVNYELGLCHALGVPTILISQNIEDVPFDYRHRRCVLYNTRAIDWQRKLESDISETIKAVLSGSAGKEELEWPYDTSMIKQAGAHGSFIRADAAKEPLLRGIEQAYEAIAMAYGPHGSSVSVAPSGAYGERLSRRGVAVASALSSLDPLVQLGLHQVRELTKEVSAELGDGTKTAALIFCEMVKDGYEALQSGVLLRDLTTEMDRAVEATVVYLKGASKPLNEYRLRGVALSAVMGEQIEGHVVVSAVNNAGKDGVVYFENSPTLSTDLLVTEGMHFNRGFVSDRFITDEPRQLAIVNNARILLCNFKLSSIQEMLPVLAQVARAQSSLLVVAPDIEGEALATIDLNNQRGTLPAVAVKAPGSGISRDMILEDIAVATGGTVFSHPSLLQHAHLAHLGSAESVEVSKHNTWLFGPGGNSALVKSRAAGIRQQISVADADFDADKLRERLASLVGATVTIRVGGASETDRSERRIRIEASLHSTQAAFLEGVLIGGGNSLWYAEKHLIKTDQSRGARVVAKALGAPLKAQLKNSRALPNAVEEQINKASSKDFGFNAIKREVTDLEADQVFDATKVVVRGLQIAFAHARNVLQTGAWEIA